MRISVRTVAGLLAAALMWDSLFAADPAAKPLVFNTTAPTNDLKGTLSAQVRFAQSQIVPVHPRESDASTDFHMARRQAGCVAHGIQYGAATVLQRTLPTGPNQYLEVASLVDPTVLQK